MSDISCGLYTMCLVQDQDKVLLLNRPDRKGFPGYIGAGGKIEFPESFSEGTVRELREETGIIVRPEDLIFKGIDEYVTPEKNYRYIVFNYLATSFKGELLENPPEGELEWVPINEALNLPMQPWFKRRFPLFFEEGTFEVSIVWDETKKEETKKSVRTLNPSPSHIHV